MNRVIGKFQFPTNGKGHPKFVYDLTVPPAAATGFNSLRTGRVIQSTQHTSLIEYLKEMFPFPTNGKGHPKGFMPVMMQSLQLGFHSLRTGRVIQRELKEAGKDAEVNVSIPYEREGSSKVARKTNLLLQIENKFQFPTNGKGHPKSRFLIIRWMVRSFNSLRTGRVIQSRLRMATFFGKHRKFQFPTNGKGHPKSRTS